VQTNLLKLKPSISFSD